MTRRLLSTSCPSCGLPMQTAAMSCPACNVKIEGSFSETFFNRLGPEDQAFLEQYLLAGFSIKTLEQNRSLGYAAIRSRLDRLIANEITVAEAKEKLERLTGE
jgi:hypothetical protein